MAALETIITEEKMLPSRLNKKHDLSVTNINFADNCRRPVERNEKKLYFAIIVVLSVLFYVPLWHSPPVVKISNMLANKQVG